MTDDYRMTGTVYGGSILEDRASRRPDDDFKRRLDHTADRIASAVPIARAIVEGRRMSKLQAVADRIASVKAQLDADGDELMAKMDAIDKMRPDAKASAHGFLDAQKADLESIEATLRQLSNLPLAGSQDSSKG